MESKQIVAMVLTLTVGIILAGSLLVPVINDASDALTVTKTNDYGAYSVVADDVTISLAIVDDEVTYTVGGVETDFDSTIFNQFIVANCIVGYYDPDTSTIVIATNLNARFTGQTSASFTFSDGSITGTSTDGTTSHSYSFDYDWAYYSAEDGDYRSFILLANETNTIYFTDLDDICGSNFAFTTSKFFSFKGDSVDYYTSGGTSTELTADVNKTLVDGTLNMYSMSLSRTGSDYTVTIDNSGTDYTLCPWVFIVPYEVTSDSQQNVDGLRAMYAVIPVIVITSLVAMAAAMIYRRD